MGHIRFEIGATNKGQPYLAFFSNDVGFDAPIFRLSADGVFSGEFAGSGKHVLGVPDSFLENVMAKGLLVSICVDPKSVSASDDRPAADVLEPKYFEYEASEIEGVCHA